MKLLALALQFALLAIGCDGCSRGHDVFAFCILVALFSSTREVE